MSDDEEEEEEVENGAENMDGDISRSFGTAGTAAATDAPLPTISSGEELSYFQRVLLFLGPFVAFGMAFLAGITHIVIDVFVIYVRPSAGLLLLQSRAACSSYVSLAQCIRRLIFGLLGFLLRIWRLLAAALLVALV